MYFSPLAMIDDTGHSQHRLVTPQESEEYVNRLNRLFVTICEDIFRAILNYHIKPKDLRQELDTNKATLEKCLNSQQKNLLYPPYDGESITSRDLDLPLAYILLRNICNIPSFGKWQNEPNKEDNSLAACIERITIKRKSFFEFPQKSLSEILFRENWWAIRRDVLEIEKQIFGTFIFERYMDDLYVRDLEPLQTKKRIKEHHQGKHFYFY